MAMEIRPIPGQPGLFRQGLGSTRTRWTGTTAPMFRAPFGAGYSPRRNGGMHGLRGLDATTQGPTIAVGGDPGEHVSQAPIPEGQVPGVQLVLYALTKGPLVPQATLDGIFRLLLGQLGYDVGASSLEAMQLMFTWVKNGNAWEARMSQGPKDLVDLKEVYKVVYDTPTPKDLESLPISIEKYMLLARPKDGTLDSARLQTLLTATRAARAAIGAQTGAETDIFLNVLGVPAPGSNMLLAGFGILAGAIGAYLVWKDTEDKKRQGYAL
jgi:hypothetical protein